ncbi:MAG TPA: carbohydrate kinase family protein [Candidatus Paceibacterota bacterium]|nr:carbohydrate kinase family protein [Candidatus Paceibacterota bacterium]
MEPLDFLAIGDIVTEPFIRLTDAEVYEKDGQQMLGMRFGDKIPYAESIHMPAVGNASNAAVAAARLGLSSALRAYIGDDAQGQECLDRLKEEGVQTEYMVTEHGKITNHHYVLWYGNERTILVKHEDYAYDVPTLGHQPKWIYLSSLAKSSLPYHHAITEMLQMYPGIKLAFQPGTFQMSLGVEALKPLYERTDFFCVNVEEAARILGVPAQEERTTEYLKSLLQGLAALGPKLICVTDGTEGAYAYDGSRYLRIPMYPDDRKPFERTGAGDAFASSITAALALGEPLETALLWGPINSMSVVQDVGAQRGLLTREALLSHLEKAPATYTVTEF